MSDEGYSIAIKIEVNEVVRIMGSKEDAELMRDAMLERAFDRIRENVVYAYAPLHPDKECFALIFKSKESKER